MYNTNKTLDSVIVYVVSQLAPIQFNELKYIIFLIDKNNFDNFGHTLTEANYTRANGFFVSKEIFASKEYLFSNLFLEEFDYGIKKGFNAKLFSCNLARDQETIIDYVISNYHYKSNEELESVLDDVLQDYDFGDPLLKAKSKLMIDTTENKASFFARLEPYLSPKEILQVKTAYIFAKFGHRAQKRKELDDDGTPLRYFEHVRRTALILIDELEWINADMISAALLHDCLEDTEDVTAELIEHMFGTNVCKMVRGLTNIPKENYIERLHKADSKIVRIKFCDRLDNVRSLDKIGVKEEFKRRKALETQDKYFPLFEKMAFTTGRGGSLLREMKRRCGFLLAGGGAITINAGTGSGKPYAVINTGTGSGTGSGKPYTAPSFNIKDVPPPNDREFHD